MKFCCKRLGFKMDNLDLQSINLFFFLQFEKHINISDSNALFDTLKNQTVGWLFDNGIHINDSQLYLLYFERSIPVFGKEKLRGVSSVLFL